MVPAKEQKKMGQSKAPARRSAPAPTKAQARDRSRPSTNSTPAVNHITRNGALMAAAVSRGEARSARLHEAPITLTEALRERTPDIQGTLQDADLSTPITHQIMAQYRIAQRQAADDLALAQAQYQNNPGNDRGDQWIRAKYGLPAGTKLSAALKQGLISKKDTEQAKRLNKNNAKLNPDQLAVALGQIQNAQVPSAVGGIQDTVQKWADANAGSGYLEDQQAAQQQAAAEGGWGGMSPKDVAGFAGNIGDILGLKGEAKSQLVQMLPLMMIQDQVNSGKQPWWQDPAAGGMKAPTLQLPADVQRANTYSKSLAAAQAQQAAQTGATTQATAPLIQGFQSNYANTLAGP